MFQVGFFSDIGCHGLIECSADECEERFADPDVPGSVLQACDVARDRGVARFLHNGLTIELRPLGMGA